MLYKGVLITQASGRIDDAVASRNRGGPYFRALGNPNPNPATDEQIYIRAAMTEVVSTWQAMSRDQRLAWEAYSQANPRTSRIGVERPAGALPEFTRSNICRAQCDLAFGTSLGFVVDPPEEGDYAWPLPMPAISVLAGSTEIDISVDPLTPWLAEEGAALLVYASPTLPLTINWYRSPMTLLGPLLGSSGDSSTRFFAADVTPAGQHRTFRFRILRADGRVSVPWWTAADAT